MPDYIQDYYPNALVTKYMTTGSSSMTHQNMLAWINLNL